MTAGDDVTRSAPDILWFLLCGARERAAKMGAFGVAGLAMTVYSDVTGSYKDTVWVRGLILTSLSLLLVLAVLLIGRRHRPLTIPKEGTNPPRRVTKTEPALPAPLHWFRDLALFGLITAVQLFGTGIGQIMLGAKADASDTRSVSLFATLIPELQGLRHEVTGVREDLGHIDQKLEQVKRETSEDPRKELANMGIAWTTDAFVEALMTSDARAVKLFLAGGMSATTNHKNASAVVYILQPGLPDPVAMLELLVAAGYDPNAKLLDYRVLYHYSDHLPPHFEAPGLPPEYAAWQGTFAGPALLWIVIRATYFTVTDNDRHAIRFLLQHGADAQLCKAYLKANEQSLGQFPAYKEMRQMLE
jgi:hypothetical protein